MSRVIPCLILACALLASFGGASAGQREGQPPTAAETRAGLAQAVSYFRSISTQGGYLWRYSLDLTERFGEGRATATQVWVQPPGTPAVGMALLRAYEATGEAQYLDAARAAADALALGQLESGGWDYRIDFNPEQARRSYRRADIGQIDAAEAARRRNASTFDDDNTQSALRLLMAVIDAAGGPRDERDRRLLEARDYGLRGLMRAQYPNGAWPQRYPPPAEGFQRFYTFNDDTMRDCVLTLLEAHRRYGNDEHLQAALRAGDFMILSQRQAPQAGWAQQYDFDLNPAPARRFEPAALCSAESAGVIRTLVDLYLHSGEERFLAPIPAAIDWLNRSKIDETRWARFYELETNRPLYYTMDYRLVYTDDDLPTHYSFQSTYGISGVIRYYEEVRRLGRDEHRRRNAERPLTAAERAQRRSTLVPRVRETIDALDAQGRWITAGEIRSQTFIAHVELLCDYLEAFDR